MDYATQADLVARFGERELIQLTDRVNIPPSTIDADLVALKLADAQAFIDGYVGQVYRLPLAGCLRPPAIFGGEPDYVPPPALTRLACDLARYYLYDDLAPENEVYRRFKAAVKELDTVATGGSQLACPWGGSPGELARSDTQSGGDLAQHCFSPRKITDDSLRGFG
jgi:phage gp36-like protein